MRTVGYTWCEIVGLTRVLIGPAGEGGAAMSQVADDGPRQVALVMLNIDGNRRGFDSGFGYADAK